MKIAVSFLKSKRTIEDTIRELNNIDCDYIHVDVMDGKFVDNISLLIRDIKKYLPNTKKKLDVHLMVKEPNKYLDAFALLNTEYITIHYEIDKILINRINMIKKYGLKVGLAIKPDTKVTEIEKYLDIVDLVLVMTVEPGKGGQKLNEKCIDKIKELKDIRKKNNYNYIISADGGINDTNISLLEKKGLDMAVVGSFICMSNDFEEQLDKLKK